jgi:hypothetical protein
MKNAIVLATVIGLGALAAGCNVQPRSVVSVQPSALPPAAKALLAPEAQITGVQLATYDKGGKDYIIDYTINGVAKQTIYGDYHQTKPTGVFEFLGSKGE